ncbi:TetR/AcrR family transcriptional regulator [Thalassotalea agarivorans]|uniref:Transcriptional regulator, TetR family n=1 Tax=Thalassotalea agarivorans TaxID=349064 RepID=A0A1H9YQ00_THASX|nr:TetR/AcrR family transcriptional regulator [Thalassotalea agarivorans]SES71221.1 transcriptional regulator, TetR family [Thalassotalea agarivorans]
MMKKKYHHGDLKSALVDGATQYIETHGVEALSFRKLAVEIGVSRTAAYHHFADKNDLLCEVAAAGFKRWSASFSALFAEKDDLSAEQVYRRFVFHYMQFAIENNKLYDLMFGATIWKENKGTSRLKSAAYPSFEQQLNMTSYWQEQGVLPRHIKSLRLSQVIWGTLHGIARLAIDGVYHEQSPIDEMCESAIQLFLHNSQ